MATTEAQKRAATKYQQEKCCTITVRFTPREKELYDRVKAQPNQAGYIKSLIKNDLES